MNFTVSMTLLFGPHSFRDVLDFIRHRSGARPTQNLGCFLPWLVQPYRSHECVHFHSNRNGLDLSPLSMLQADVGRSRIIFGLLLVMGPRCQTLCKPMGLRSARRTRCAFANRILCVHRLVADWTLLPWQISQSQNMAEST